MPKKQFPAAASSLEQMLSFVEDTLEEAGFPAKAAMQVAVCAEEIFINIAHYAYPDGMGEMTLSVEADDRQASLSFTDRGVPFDPLAKADPDISLSAEERRIGGLGIFMVKQTMDDVSYEYRDGRNIFTMKKQSGSRKRSG